VPVGKWDHPAYDEVEINPDFKTIVDFRHINRKAFRTVFRQFVLLCRKLGLFGLKTL